MQAYDALGLGFKHTERRQCGCGHRRRHTYGINEARGRVSQELDQYLTAGDVAAARSERLAQCTHPDIHLERINVAMLGAAASALPEDANPVGIVDHEPRPVAFFEVDEAGEIGHIAL